jgi:tryptophan synthase alpha chain
VDRRIDQIFADLRASRTKALMPFVCGGFPAPGVLPALLPALAAAGGSIVEIGFPFSDPIADGPVIAQAMHQAIGAGASAASVFDEVRSVRQSLSIGLVAMVSASIIHRLGGGPAFCARAAESGFDGLIVPDLPLEESVEIAGAATERGLTYSHLIAPTTPITRAEELVKASTGFVYLVTRAGLTGEQRGVPEIANRVSRLRQLMPLPIACGFGVSTADHVRAVVNHADAAIVGSAIVRRMTDAQSAGGDAVRAATEFTRSLAQGLMEARELAEEGRGGA